MSLANDLFLLDCPSYEDYIDTFITRNDVRYIRSLRFCRMLVQLGYRSQSEILTTEQFDSRKAAVYESLWSSKKSTALFSEGRIIGDPVLKEFAAREKPNIQKKISTIVFIKHRLKSGFEVSGYIDLEDSFKRANAHREDSIDWAGVFDERLVLRPKPYDLSFFDWHTGAVVYNNSENFVILHDIDFGLIFMHRGDHKKICVDVSRELYSRNCTRSMHFSEKYGHVIFYDHVIRKKI